MPWPDLQPLCRECGVYHSPSVPCLEKERDRLQARVAELEAAGREAVDAWTKKNNVRMDALFGQGDSSEALEVTDQFHAAMQRLLETIK